MIVRQGREVIGIHRNGHNVSEVWKYIDGVWRSVWQTIKSCFGSGYWVNEKPWLNDEPWK